MADTNETIADIIAEMRGMGNYQRYSGDHARVLAGRIEAAHKRERGDAAKLREALEATNKFLESAIINGKVTAQDITDLRNIVSAALSAPPRNCDKYSHDEALRIWSAESENPMNGCFDVWLFAPATEKEGGAK